MRLRDQVALTLPSLFLRLALGVTFLWAGTGKFMGTTTVTGDDAARLANLGIIATPITPSHPGLVTPPETPTDPSTQTPHTPQEGSPQIPPTVTPTETTEPPKPADAQSPINGLNEQAKEIIDLLNNAPADDATDSTEPTSTNDKPVIQPIQYTPERYAGADFPDPMEVKQVYAIALMLSKASDPGLTGDSKPIDPILPKLVGTKPWAKVLAWAAAITELVGGAFLILGVLTRISALATLTLMLVAMWMTQIGPATIQSHDALLGFIPHVSHPWSPGSYSELLWQVALASMSLAVFFLGSGPIGIDRILLKPMRRDPYLHGDPKGSKDNKHSKVTKNARSSPPPDRSSFDRTPNPTP